ncbi:MAG: cytochrome c [Porticoccus sp.]|jgi:cytochrome c553|nr:cytochrome c [Porticoccus sp.]|tara:strand:- start:2187 stop:2486 length:300 start_codon:yes stop_codon:yes gene_type:complete
MKKIVGLVIILVIAAASPAFAGDAAAGKEKAMVCAGCHGAAGISANPMWPNLAGQQAGYLAAQIKHFRDGKRINAMMNNMVKTLSDEDADNLAAYYSGL